jgi:hypothetical protein
VLGQTYLVAIGEDVLIAPTADTEPATPEGGDGRAVTADLVGPAGSAEPITRELVEDGIEARPKLVTEFEFGCTTQLVSALVGY